MSHRTRRLLLCLAILICSAAGCKTNDTGRAGGSYPAPSPNETGPAGPTLMARVEGGGYELKNRWVRAVIDDRSGDVTYWGAADGRRNLLMQPGVIVRLDGAPDLVPDGYIEKRDDQTWQFLGKDPDGGVGWRKIYCLDGESLYVSCLVQNLREQPRAVRVVMAPNFAGLRMTSRRADLLAGENGFAHVRMQAFNLTRSDDGDEPADRLASDQHALKPQERISFTTEWRLSPAGGAQ